MRSFSFPDMFKLNSSNILSNKEATESNLKLLLLSEKGELFGDPYFGLNLKRYLFNQNNQVLKDIIIDEIYTQVSLFMPQLIVKREDIILVSNKRASLKVYITALNQLDFTTNLYEIALLQEESN